METQVFVARNSPSKCEPSGRSLMNSCGASFRFRLALGSYPQRTIFRPRRFSYRLTKRSILHQKPNLRLRRSRLQDAGFGDLLSCSGLLHGSAGTQTIKIVPFDARADFTRLRPNPTNEGVSERSEDCQECIPGAFCACHQTYRAKNQFQLRHVCHASKRNQASSNSGQLISKQLLLPIM